MERLLAPSLLSDRIRHQMLEDERSGILANGAHRLMRAALENGEVPRGDVPAIVRASERTGQRITKSLIENGCLQSEGHTRALDLRHPVGCARSLVPVAVHEPAGGSGVRAGERSVAVTL